jgi:hypothetical protein
MIVSIDTSVYVVGTVEGYRKQAADLPPSFPSRRPFCPLSKSVAKSTEKIAGTSGCAKLTNKPRMRFSPISEWFLAVTRLFPTLSSGNHVDLISEPGEEVLPMT